MINETGKWILANEKSQMKNCHSLMRNKTFFSYMVYLGGSSKSGGEGWRQRILKLEQGAAWVLDGFS